MENKKTVWEVLSAIDCNGKTEKRNGFTYLSWAWAWGITMKHYPDATHEVTQWNGKPYLFDEQLGYMVETHVTIEGVTRGMYLPVMDSSNKAQKHEKYSYFVAEWVNGRKTGKLIEKTVEPATMFDINTAIMRCLVKNLSLFGLGHYIYAGEDLPEEVKAQQEQAKQLPPVQQKPIESVTLEWTKTINSIDSVQRANDVLLIIKAEKANDATKQLFNTFCKNKGFQFDKTTMQWT